MQTLKTGESFEDLGHKITRLGAVKEASQSDWALFCVSKGECESCDGAGHCKAKEEGAGCLCHKDHVHLWVKTGHSFSVGGKGCKLVSSNREESTIKHVDGAETGAGDC